MNIYTCLSLNTLVSSLCKSVISTAINANQWVLDIFGSTQCGSDANQEYEADGEKVSARICTGVRMLGSDCAVVPPLSKPCSVPLLPCCHGVMALGMVPQWYGAMVRYDGCHNPPPPP